MSQTGALKTDSGFTILEFLVVICIAGIASASLAIWMHGAFDRSELAKVSAQLEKGFARVARQASHTGKDQVVRIKRSAVSTEFQFKEETVRIEQPIEAGWVAAAETGSSDQLATIVFFGTGGCSGGTLELTDGRLKSSLSIDWLTARTRLIESPL